MPFISTANAAEMLAHPCAEPVPVQKRSFLDRYWLATTSGSGADMDETKMIEIETKLAHQDQLLIELNQVLTDQQTQLMRLEELFTAMVERVRTLADNSPDSPPQDEAPPHY